jgi:hypothetical protein
MAKLTDAEIQAGADIGLDVKVLTEDYSTKELAVLRDLIKRKTDEAAKSKAQSITDLTNTQESTTYKERLKLTPASAKELLSKAAADAQYIGTLSSTDISDFISKFQKEADAQMAIVIKDAQSRMTPGATATDLAKTVSSLITTNYPSFFKPETFAKDYVWSKINFADDKSLAGANMATLSQVRQLVKDFNVLGVSDAEIAQAAKDIAMKKKTLADYTTEVQQIAIKEHPALADRFKANPTLTTKDIANPPIQLLAKLWEVDPSTITMDDPIIAAYLQPGGADGKGPTLTYADVTRLGKTNKRYESTTAANEDARDAAVSFARAIGGGI